MATRVYLPSDVQTLRAKISPGFDAGWETSGSTFRLPLARSKQEVDVGGARLWTANGTLGNDTLSDQFVVGPLKAQTIAGTLKGMIQAKQSVATPQCSAALVAKVVAPDGTVRGTLLAAFGGGTLYPTTQSSIKFPPAWTGSGTTLSSVDAQDGDYLVIEVGTHQAVTSAATITLVIGDVGTADLSETEGGTVGSPWFEFSQDIVFQASVVPSQPLLPLLARLGIPGLPIIGQVEPQVDPQAGVDLIAPEAGLVATSDVTAAVVRQRPVTPAGIVSSSDLSASVVRARPVTPAGITATSAVTATVSRGRPVVPAGITATSTVAASVGLAKLVTPAGITATSNVTATVVRLRPVTPAGITASSNVTATVVRRRPVAPAAITATSTVTASVVRLRPIAGASISATSTVSATITARHAVTPAGIVATSNVSATVSGGGAVTAPLRERDLLGVGL